MEKDEKKKGSALKAAFPYTLPILAGWFFVGLAYGTLMVTSGFPIWVPVVLCLTIFAGAMQFAAVPMLLAPFDPVSAFIIAIAVQFRHLFYGLPMLSKLKGMGLKKAFIVYYLGDEAFSLINGVEPPENVDRGRFMLSISVILCFYWAALSAIGAEVGSLVTFDTEGLDFALTALFVVFFIESAKKEKKHYSSLIGIIASTLCLIIFGAKNFIIPSMAVIMILMIVFRKTIEKYGMPDEEGTGDGGEE